MPTVKPATLAWLAAATLTASPAFAQDGTPPPLAPPPASPGAPAPNPPPAPPNPREDARRDRPDRPEKPDKPPRGVRPHGPPRDEMREEAGRREPVTFLGVGVEPVPPVLVDQLNLPEGFGLIVAYVVPGSPADKAGVKTHDILKSLDDQTLVAPDQLSTLVRNIAEGKQVTLTVLHKGQEGKINVKLEKQIPPPMMDERRPRRMPFRFDGRRDHDDEDDTAMDFEADDAGPGMDRGRRDHAGSPPPPPAPPVRDILGQLRPELREAMREATDASDRGMREADRQMHLSDGVRDALQKQRKEITILRNRDGASRTTKFDLGQARIVVRDKTGEMTLKVDNADHTLVAKDADGKLLFNGPVNTDEERKAMPPEVRARLEKLEHEQMPDLAPAPPKPADTPKTE